MALPETLPGEPALPTWNPLSILATLTGRLLILLVVITISLPAWPPYLLARAFAAHPPPIPRTRLLTRTLKRILTEQPTPNLPIYKRAALLISLLQRWATSAWGGLFWYLDELFYGRTLDHTPLIRPLFEISAARSGSTQLAHYIEEDPGICAPNLMQILMPYLWLWKLAALFPGKLVTKDQVRAFSHRFFPALYIERHELDVFCTDTFEIAFLTLHLADLLIALGPQAMMDELTAVRLNAYNETLWKEDFCRMIDRIGRKTVAFYDPQNKKKLMIKGHFLVAAPFLAQQHPDARFLTMIRSPEKRLQSVINFHRVQPHDLLVGPPAWDWLVAQSLDEEIAYSQLEQQWYQQQDPTRCCLIRFDDYLHDLPGTLARVYREVLDLDQPSPHLPQAHATRNRQSYQIDRSLTQLEIDLPAFRAQLTDYYVWCKGTTHGNR